MSGWTKQQLVALSFAAGCVYPGDVQVFVPEAGSAKSIAFATRSATETKLEAFEDVAMKPIVRTERLGDGATMEVAALLYAEPLAELRIPAGEIEVPESAPDTGRPLPFERGFRTNVPEVAWGPLEAIPDWLATVRVPEEECVPPETEVKAFGVTGDRVRGVAGNGRELFVAALSTGGQPHYFAITSTAVEELDTGIPDTFRPRAATATVDGRFVVAGVTNRPRLTEVWIGDRGGFTRMMPRLDRYSGELEIEVGRSPEDRDHVYLMTELGEVLDFDGTTWTTLRAPTVETMLDDDRFGLAWAAPNTIFAFGPYAVASGRAGAVDRLDGTSTTAVELFDSMFPTTIAFHPEHGVLVGASTGDIVALSPAGDRELIATNVVFSRAVFSVAPFRGDLATGGTNGAFAYARTSATPCLKIVSGMSLSTLVPLGDQLISVNRNTAFEPEVVRIR